MRPPLQAIRLWCVLLLLFLLPPASCKPPNTKDRLFSVSSTCSDVDDHFRRMALMLRRSTISYRNLGPSGTDVTAAQVADPGIKQDDIEKTILATSEPPMAHAHLVTGMASFDMYARKQQ